MFSGGKTFQFFKKNWAKKKMSGQKIIYGEKIMSGSLQLTVGSWQVSVRRWRMSGGSWQVVVSRWQVEGGMWPNCLGAVRMADIRCLHWPLG